MKRRVTPPAAGRVFGRAAGQACFAVSRLASSVVAALPARAARPRIPATGLTDVSQRTLPPSYRRDHCLMITAVTAP